MRGTLAVGAAAVAALALAGAASAAPRVATLSARALAERHGLRVDRIAVVGGGGLVDLRVTVLDPEKARGLIGGHLTPRLVVLPSGKVLAAPGHGGRSVPLREGATGYVLFPNAGNAVRPGGAVSVEFGALRVEPVQVR